MPSQHERRIDPALRESVLSVLTNADPMPCCAYLFGSVARGEDRADSDLDLAVLYADDPPRTLAGLHLHLADRLTGALGGRRVDLVVLNRAPVDLVQRVLRDAVLLLERDRSARIRFEVKARSAYFDLLPHLREYRRAGAVDR